MVRLVFYFITTIVCISFLTGCYTFNPRSDQMSLIIVSAILEKEEPILDELFQPYFHKVTLRKGEMEMIYSKNSSHYFYFQNLSPGQYELGTVVHYLNRGMGGQMHANQSVPQVIEPPLTKEDRLLTLVNVEPGSVHFLGELLVKVKIQNKEPIQLEGRWNKSVEAERRALNHLIRNFPRSGWSEFAKDRLTLLNQLRME